MRLCCIVFLLYQTAINYCRPNNYFRYHLSMRILPTPRCSTLGNQFRRGISSVQFQNSARLSFTEISGIQKAIFSTCRIPTLKPHSSILTVSAMTRFRNWVKHEIHGIRRNFLELLETSLNPRIRTRKETSHSLTPPLTLPLLHPISGIQHRNFVFVRAVGFNDVSLRVIIL